MLLSSGSATNSALASAALSEMRGLKAAVVTTIGEMGGGVGKTEPQIQAAIDIAEMAKRMEKPDLVKEKYKIHYVGSTGIVSIEPVEAKVGGPEVIEKLKSNAALDPTKGEMAFPRTWNCRRRQGRKPCSRAIGFLYSLPIFAITLLKETPADKVSPSSFFRCTKRTLPIVCLK